MNKSLQSQVYAALDLGSNSFHMLVAKYEDGQLQPIDRDKEMVRLAAGLTKGGKLSKQVMDRGLDCIGRFGERTRDMHADVVRAVGTDALRKAKNADVFLSAAEKLLGHPIDVITGEEEARLVYLGASHSLPESDGKRLVVDIGGGSTELILGHHFEPSLVHSLDLGCVGLTEEFFPGGKISEKRWQRARRAAKDKVKPLRSELKAWDEAIGTSGTIRCIQNVALQQGWSTSGISKQALKSIEKYLITTGQIDSLDLSGLSARRKPVFAGGVIALQAVFSVLEIENMSAASGALREGLVYDMIASTYPDYRD